MLLASLRNKYSFILLSAVFNHFFLLSCSTLSGKSYIILKRLLSVDLVQIPLLWAMTSSSIDDKPKLFLQRTLIKLQLEKENHKKWEVHTPSMHTYSVPWERTSLLCKVNAGVLCVLSFYWFKPFLYSNSFFLLCNDL